MRQERLTLKVEDASPAETATLIEEVCESIHRTGAAAGLGSHIKFEIEKDRSDTQDFGSTLILVFGTPACIAVAKGVHDFIARKGNRVTIRTENGSVVATGSAADNIDVSATAAALRVACSTNTSTSPDL